MKKRTNKNDLRTHESLLYYAGLIENSGMDKRQLTKLIKDGDFLISNRFILNALPALEYHCKRNAKV